MSDTFNSVIVGNKVFRYRKEQILATDPPLDRHELSVKELSRQLEEAREELLNYKVKYNNQCAEMNRLKQSRKDQLAMIRKLKG